ncbi:DUF5672 family protein [Pontibacter harenae]|uniref:DUF5672 family protein n=1 Tax=Pontibacter harenae TaxID=2894083 RepID=UPI001E334E04|nr:DUF5672 family protein [Pontibacter harenae]MCC9168232.1 hypothetical protein [Pontibacter harenae]
MKLYKPVVVIPLHSSTPSKEELLSFKQCYKILAKHDIIIVHPAGLDLSAYKKIQDKLKTLPIDPIWQSSLENYNRLKCSSFFYNLFSEYNYLLTYELDAFVFKDELDFWCEKGYSYIGAPWFVGYANPITPYKFKGVGNSGFSLRNIQICSVILSRIELIKKIVIFYNSVKLDAVFPFATFLRLSPLKYFFKIIKTHNVPNLISKKYVHEDLFWADWISGTFSDFKVATYEEAMRFSFEVNPEFLYLENNKELPFGCHAWLKYNPLFWKKFITNILV